MAVDTPPTKLDISSPRATEVVAGVADSQIVQAPDDHELYSYFGPQKRWVSLCMSLAFALAALSIFRFSQTAWWLWPLLVVLIVNICGSIISMISGLNRRRLSRSSHDALVHTWRPLDVPSVDVFLPSCGEPMEVLTNTYEHVARLEWPGVLTVWVLDDAAKDDVRALAESFGFEYRVRPNRGEMKKAGNLKYGFGESSGDVIAIFDADFCPRADYLRHLVPYLDATDVGIVQSPQAFETDLSMSWLQRTAGATQELFYRWVQPSRDAAGAPICVGTNAIYRRAALVEIGGFAQIEHSEDVHTGIALLRAGYSTQYVPIVVAKGLCPDDLSAFINQQYRWCNGSITLLKSGDAQRRPLSIRQRMCFWAGFMYYISTAVNVFALHIPMIVMAFVFPENVRAAHYVPFMAGVWVYLVLLPRVFQSRWRLEVLRVQMVYSFSHAVAITHKLMGRTAAWVPTGAVSSSSHLSRTVGRVAINWLTVSIAASWIGVIIAVPQYGLANFWPMVMFLIGYTHLTLPLVVDLSRMLSAGRAAQRAKNDSSAGPLRISPSLGRA